MTHPSVLVIVEHFLLELNYAEYVVGRQNVGKRGRAPKKNKFTTAKEEAERLQTLYASGEIAGGTMGYLKQMGYLHHQMLEEISKIRNTKSNEIIQSVEEPRPNHTTTTENNEQSGSNLPGRTNTNRLVELQELGFGERSFSFQNSPYRNRIIGQTARVQALQENLQNQPNFDLKNKKCLKC